MSRRTLLLIIFLIAVTAGLFVLALKGPSITPVNKQPETAKPVAPAADSSLVFGVVSTASSESGELVHSLPIVLDTKSNKATAVQLELSYNPEILTNVSTEQGNFFANPVVLINAVDAKNGRVSYALGIPPGANGKTGQGTVATLNFQTLKNAAVQTTIIALLPKSLVTAEGIDKSVLKSGAAFATINLKDLILLSPAISSPVDSSRSEK